MHSGSSGPMGELQHAHQDPNAYSESERRVQDETGVVKKELEHIRSERAGGEIAFTVERRDGKSREYRSAASSGRVQDRTRSDDAAAEVLQRAGVKIGDEITEHSLRSIAVAASAVDEHL